MLRDLPEDMSDSETGPFLMKMKEWMVSNGELPHLAPYTYALMHAKFKAGRAHLRRRSVAGDTRRRSCDCPAGSTCSCEFAGGSAAFPSRRHLQLSLHEINYFRPGRESPPERQPSQLAKLHGEAPTASLFGCPCERMAPNRVVKQLTDEQLAFADVDGVVLASKFLAVPSDEEAAALGSSSTHEKLAAVSKDIEYLFESAGESMTVGEFHKKHGYLIDVLHVLNLAVRRGKNPHWLARTYGGPWFLSRLAFLLKIRLRVSRGTGWPWFWVHVAVLTDDKTTGVAARAKASLERCFPSGPASFFSTFGELGSFDPILLSVCICSHKERSRGVVGGCGTEGYAWDGK
jgi:hypothetical protein